MENMNLNETAISFLHIIRKWTKIISIIMFVMIGLMILIGIMLSLFMKTLTNGVTPTPMPLPAGAMALMYVLMAALYFFPVYYLYQFSLHLENALNARSEDELTHAFMFLKNHYTFVGVLMIIGIVMMIFAFIIAIFAGLAGVAATMGGNSL